MFKSYRYFILLSLLSFGYLSAADNSTMSMDLLYKGGKKNFMNLQVKISAYGRSLHFDSFNGDRYALDCQQSKKSPYAWICSNPCESGSVSLEFVPKKGFSEFTIKKLAVRPRHCDGTESDLDKWVSSEKPMSFNLSKTSKNYTAPMKKKPNKSKSKTKK